MLNRPMYRMVWAAAKRGSLHMPATGGRPPFGRMKPYRWDTTELPVTDDLYRPTGAIAEAQSLAARSAGAAHTLMLHGGSTAGIHAMLLYACKRGDSVILPRNVHASALNLCAMAGIEPVFTEMAYTALGRPYATAQAYQRAVEETPDAKAVLVVRPDYYGLAGDLPAIAAGAHARGLLVLCDEAHGAHFNWHPAMQNAGACGADLFVQSAHKTLPALTAGAWLHAAEGTNVQRLRALLRMVQTSSPSFLNMVSLDDARAWMDVRGAKACVRLQKALDAFYAKAERLGYARGQCDAPEGCRYDPLRLVLRAPEGGYGLSGALSARGIDMEMCDGECVVGIVPLRGGEARLRRLWRALKDIQRAREREAGGQWPETDPAQVGSGGQGQGLRPEGTPAVQAEANAQLEAASPNIHTHKSIPSFALPRRVMPLSVAAFAPAEAVEAREAGGRIAAAHVGFYPPGVALLAAGEEISAEMAAFLEVQQAERLFGLADDGRILCVAEEWAAKAAGQKA